MKHYLRSLAAAMALISALSCTGTSVGAEREKNGAFTYVDEIAGIEFGSIASLSEFISENAEKKTIKDIEPKASAWLLNAEGVYLPKGTDNSEVTSVIITPTYVCAAFYRNGTRIELTEYTDEKAGQNVLDYSEYEIELNIDDAQNVGKNGRTVYYSNILTDSIYVWEQDNKVFRLRVYSDAGFDSGFEDMCEAELFLFSEIKNGWQTDDGKTYYYKDGVMLTKSTVIDGIRYKFGSDGVCKGKFSGSSTGSKGRRFWKNGVLLKDRWITLKNGNSYYAGRDGYARTGWAAVTKGDGFYSYFDKNGIWDGKTYWTGYKPENLYSFFLDFDMLSGTKLYSGYTKSDVALIKDKSEFTAIETLRSILEKDLYKRTVKDSVISDDENELNEKIYRGGKCITIVSAEDNHAFLKFSKDKQGNTYVFNTYYGFGLRLGDKDAYDKLADVIDNL